MTKPHLAPLTSLRFFAAALVVFEHYFGFRYGHAGVSFFYVLSGFILAYNYGGRLSSPGALRAFFAKRIARLYPIHVLTLVAALPPALLIDFRQHLAWAPPAFLANLFLLQSFVPEKLVYFGFNSVSWSISDEAFFYAVFPIAGAILCKSRSAAVWIGLAALWLALASLAVAWRQIGLDPTYEHWFFYINPLVRLTEFVAGMVIGLGFGAAKRKTASSGREVAALATAALAIGAAYHIPERAGSMTYALLFILPSLWVVATFARGAGAISRLLSAPFMVLLGEASFALYMTHQLFLRYLLLVFGESLPLKLIALALATPMAVLAFLWFEKPAQKWVLKRLLPGTGAAQRA